MDFFSTSRDSAFLISTIKEAFSTGQIGIKPTNQKLSQARIAPKASSSPE
jgi:hypothetical protein